VGLLFPNTVDQPIESTIIFLTALSNSLDFGLLLREGQMKEQVKYKVQNGGSWTNFGRNCRSALRYNDTPNNRNAYIGLRIVVRGARSEGT
jgi:hypothetical protein